MGAWSAPLQREHVAKRKRALITWAVCKGLILNCEKKGGGEKKKSKSAEDLNSNLDFDQE